MVHKFFQNIAFKSGLANYHANLAIRNGFGKKPFSEIFPTFFMDDGYLHPDKGLDSWLDAISTGFEFKEIVPPQLLSEVVNLFRALNIEDFNAPPNKHVFQFWVYLVWLYEKLVEENCGGEGNTFAFLSGIETSSTKVVFMGNLPIINGGFNGYAFHGSKSQATKQLLEFAARELEIVSRFTGDSLLTISSGQLEKAKQICDLSGWIRQGVLLLNGCLSSQESGPLYNAWQILINFVIRHLSNSVTKVVFVLFGEAVHSKETLINLPINFVMKLAHPDQYSQNAPAPHPPIAMTMDWNVFPPFMTSNFYLLRERGVNAIIDWKSIGTLSPGINWRVMMNARFCNDFIQWNRQAILSGQRQFAVHNGIMITW